MPPRLIDMCAAWPEAVLGPRREAVLGPRRLVQRPFGPQEAWPEAVLAQEVFGPRRAAHECKLMPKLSPRVSTAFPPKL